MVVFKNKQFTKCADFPNEDFIGNADWILDDNDPKDAELEEKIISNYPNFEFIFDDEGKPIDITPIEPAPMPPAPPTNEELAAAVAELADIIMGGMM